MKTISFRANSVRQDILLAFFKQTRIDEIVSEPLV
jgi:hypothetical protein